MRGHEQCDMRAPCAVVLGMHGALAARPSENHKRWRRVHQRTIILP